VYGPSWGQAAILLIWLSDGWVAVNVATRFEQMAEDNTVMMGDGIFCRCRGFIHAEKEGEIKLRNHTRPVKDHVVSD